MAARLGFVPGPMPPGFVPGLVPPGRVPPPAKLGRMPIWLAEPPVMPEPPEAAKPMPLAEPVREMDGSDGTEGKEVCEGETPEPVEPTRERIFDFSPSEGANSEITLLILPGSATFFAVDRKAK